MVLVSVIVPVYNAEKYLEKCIQSLLEQDIADYEVILVDDGSTDKSATIIDEYCSKSSVLRSVHKSNGGVSSARNQGLKMAKGKYIAFVDSDDYVDKDYLSSMVSSYTKEDIDLVVSSMLFDDIKTISEKEGEYSPVETACRFYTRNSFQGYLVNKLFKASIITENNITFDENSHFCEDLLFCAEYVRYIRKTCYTDKACYHYCLNNGSATQDRYSEKRFSVFYTYKRMIDVLSCFDDDELHSLLQVNFLIHIIRLKRILYVNHINDESWMLMLNNEIKKRRKYFFSRYMPIKEKIRFILAELRI